ncbi:MAG: signal peptidase I [Candidatus Gracilibacteria bacterium]
MNKKTNKVLLWILDVGLNVAIIVGLVLVIQTWIIAPFDVSGASMCDTLNNINGQCENGYGEKILLNEAGYSVSTPQRGDIVVFKPEGQDDKYFIKRVIGLPGETVELKEGKVFVTDSSEKTFELQEDYLNSVNKDNTQPFFSDLKVFEVPEDRYFLMGDNRKFSTDSRSCFEGQISSDCRKSPNLIFVPRSHIRGKAWLVFWPLQNMRFISLPDYNQTSDSLEEK